MRPDFTNIFYLKSGNLRQQAAYRELKKTKLFEILAPYKPILAGTIPLGIDLAVSDLDIICQAKEIKAFGEFITQYFGCFRNFKMKYSKFQMYDSVIITFDVPNFPIEIFAQNNPTTQQYAYRHLLAEYHILQTRNKIFKDQIIQLKKQGFKTEPAFAKALGLKGNPYEELLAFSD